VLHATGSPHGGVEPGKILIQGDGCPVLLGPPTRTSSGSGAVAELWTDLRDVAEVARFMINGAPIRVSRQAADPSAAVLESLSFHDRRMGYGHEFLRVIDSAASPQGALRLHSVAGFREQLREAPRLDNARYPTDLTISPLVVEFNDRDEAPDHLRRPADAGRRRTSGAAVAVAALLVVLGLGALLVIRSAVPTVVAGPANAASSVLAPVPLPPSAASAASAAAPQPASVPMTVPDALPPSVAAAAPGPAPDAGALAPTARPDHATKSRPPSAVSSDSKRVQRSDAAAAAARSPRQICGPRTQFSLYRCMQQQCARAAWVRHPQCVRLRVTDRVD